MTKLIWSLTMPMPHWQTWSSAIGLMLTALTAAVGCETKEHTSAPERTTCPLGTVGGSSGCTRDCDSVEYPSGRCGGLGEAFATDVPGVMLSFAGDGFIFEVEEGTLTRYSVSRGVTRINQSNLAFRPVAYYDGHYYGTRDGHVYRGKDPRLPGEVVTHILWAHERTLAVDADGVFYVQAGLMRAHNGREVQLMATFPDPKINRKGLAVWPLPPNGNEDTEYTEDVATSHNEVYLAQVDTRPLRSNSHIANNSRIAAVGKSGANPRIIAAGTAITHLATNDIWLYYSDMDKVYGWPQSGGDSRKLMSGYGFISALGVSDTHLYVGVEPKRSMDDQPSAHRSWLYRIPRPICDCTTRASTAPATGATVRTDSAQAASR